MFFYKVRRFFPKLQYLIICLIFCIASFVLVFYTSEEPEDCFPEEAMRNYAESAEEEAWNSSVDVSALLAELGARNEAAEVRNLAEYGPLRGDTPLLVVTVRRERARLRRLLAALARVSGLDELLVVFSHAHYDRATDALVRSLDSCMVVQIYYPHSVQLHPPAVPPRGAAALDIERKNHWWWTARYVFERLPGRLPGRRGLRVDLALFIDETSCVLPDLAHMVAVARYARAHFPHVDVFAFGRAPAPGLEYDVVSVEAWRPPLGEGLALGGDTWRRVAAFGRHYCQHDDGSWSGSLAAVFARWSRGRAVALCTQAPRVQPGAAACCAPRRALFPRRVRLVVVFSRAGVALHHPAPPPGNGGWTGSAHHALCLALLEDAPPEEHLGHNQPSRAPAPIAG